MALRFFFEHLVGSGVWGPAGKSRAGSGTLRYGSRGVYHALRLYLLPSGVGGQPA